MLDNPDIVYLSPSAIWQPWKLDSKNLIKDRNSTESLIYRQNSSKEFSEKSN